MGKHKSTLQTHHLYLGAGGMLSVAALVIALTFGLSSADEYPMGGGMMNTAEMQTSCTSAGGTWNGSYCQMPTVTNTTPIMDTASMSSGCTSAGGTWDGTACQMPITTTPSMPAGGCPAGQYWSGTACVVNPTTPTTTTSTCITPGYVQCPSRNNECVTTTDCANATPVCGSGQTPSSGTPCRASADTATTPASSCPSGQYWSGTACVTSPTTPMPGTTMTTEEMQRGCATAGGTWNSANTPPCTMPNTTTTTPNPTYSYTVRCPALNNREVSPEECGAATPYCAEGTFPSMENPCKSTSTMTSTQTAEMMQCANQYNPNGAPMYLPKEYKKWDPVTRQETVKHMNSCEDWYAQFREDEARMMTGGRTMPNPTGAINCQQDYRNPFCRSGNLDHEARFKDVVKDKKDYIDDVKLGDNLADEVRTLKLEAVVKDPNDPVECRQTIGPFPGPFPLGGPVSTTASARPSFVRPTECDVIDAEGEMMNISLEAGIACPVSGSIQEVLDQVKPDFDFIRGLTGKSPAEKVKEGRARLQRAREALQQLVGSWDDVTETSKPGLMQGLNSCRDIGYLTRDAKRMLDEFQYLSDTDEYKELASFVENPLAYLPSGVDIFAPFEPDMDVCFDANMIMGGSSEEEFDENFDEEPGIRGGQCGFFEPPSSFMPKAECLPPAMRYLGMQYGVLHDLAKALTEKGCESEGQMKGRFACEGFKQAPAELAKNGRKLPKEVRDIVDGFVSEGTQYCDDGDDESAERIFRAMMQTVMPYMRGKDQFGNTKKQVIDQMKERGVIGDKDKKTIAALEKEIGLLNDQLSAMEVKIQELLVAKVALEQQLGKVKDVMQNLNIESEHIARLQGNDATSQIGRRLAGVNEKHMSLVSSILEVLPRGASACKASLAEALDATFKGLSTEGNRTVDQMLDGLYSKVSSGALTAEEVVKACEGVKERFIALADSGSEIDAARKEGVIAFKDTPLNHWAGSFALIAVNNNLATATNESVGVGNNEMYAQAIVRAVRLGAMADPENMGKKLGEYLALNQRERDALVLEKDVPGVADVKWARPFVAVCQEFDVKECLTPPVKSLTDTVTRAQMAGLLVHVLEAAGITRGSTSNIVTPTDSADHAYLNEIKVVKAWGVMGGCSGPADPNFCPDQPMNVGMDLVAAVNCSNHINATLNFREAAANLEE
ncbi:hypothetical protein HYW83_05695 [Candidatus Peregrinibacteria bacterium]|nr:hypothetical protein [Candidatus Peregrinibacteria bacterium]